MSGERVNAFVPNLVDSRVDTVGSQRGVPVEERRTVLWMAVGMTDWDPADLREVHPPVVDERKFRVDLGWRRPRRLRPHRDAGVKRLWRVFGVVCPATSVSRISVLLWLARLMLPD